MERHLGSYYKQQLNDWVASLDVSANLVFDIGGAQSPIRGRTNSWSALNYKIVDLAEPHSNSPAPDIAQDMNEPLTEDFEEFIGEVDLIFMLGVMDYVINPNVAMENIRLLLKHHGTAWVEFPYFYCTHNPVDDEGCRYSEGCINRLAKQAGLKITERVYKYPKPGNNHLVQFFVEDGMRMASGVDHRVTGFLFKFERNR